MDDYGYSWRNTRQRSSFFLPKSEHFGRWVLIAIVLGVVFHGLLYFALEKIPVLVELIRDKEEKSEPSRIKMIAAPKTREIPEIDPRSLDVPLEDTKKLSEEIAELEDVMDDAVISPHIDEIFQDIQFEAPAAAGSLLTDDFEPILGPDFDLDVPEIGLNNELLTNHLHGEIKVDPGQAEADIFDPDQFTQELIKKGAEGDSNDGLLEGFTSLEQMKELDGNALENAKALIGSDLLFEFGKAELKSSAMNSLMAVAFLIDKNSEMFCILNGHTDLFGSEAANKVLSRKRALAVKEWLVKSALIDTKRIVVIAHGMSNPIVQVGDRDEQALNRRVVIQMKAQRPSIAPVVPEVAPEVAPEEEEVPEAIPRAQVSEDVPRAIPEVEVVEEIPRAVPE